MPPSYPSEEHQRIAQADEGAWRKWGPYVSDRAWATVREDYSGDGDVWTSFPHDQARMRAYRWSEDGIAGFCDDHQNLCMAVAFWNGQDAILKERFFGLTGSEGNHGEDVKELYAYLDCTPTSSYARMLYRYPQVAFPYGELIRKNAGREGPEWEIFDELRAAFAADEYHEVTVEYAKAGPEDILCRITVKNRGPQVSALHVLPHLWYRNYWSWPVPAPERPSMEKAGDGAVRTSDRHPHLARQWWYAQAADGATPELLFTENETNARRLGFADRGGRFFKDGVNAYLIPAERHLADGVMHRQTAAIDWVNPANAGSKVAAHFRKDLLPGETWEIRVRLAPAEQAAPFAGFEGTLATRQAEADRFYRAVQPAGLSADAASVQRQALAGLLWSRQFYRYDVEAWLEGDASSPPPPARRYEGRNARWRHFDAGDVISMPDAWEYPWFAAWDLAFHCVALSLVDPALAKSQLTLLLREYYLHPNGQIPAYEWEFSDVNPPVTAWAALQVYRREKAQTGRGDRAFLKRVFHKELLNFTWWVNREDLEDDNLFQGGFLGLDNISLLDRSALGASRIEQADGTAWVAVFCANMMSIAIELAMEDAAYEDLAIKFLDHFTYIARALVNPQQIRGDLEPLWDGRRRFFFDHLYPGGQRDDVPLEIYSFVGLVPLLAVGAIEPLALAKLPAFDAHRRWLLANRAELLGSVAPLDIPGQGGRLLLSLLRKDMLRDVLEIVLDENRMLSPFGVRSLSKEHALHPFTATVSGVSMSIAYDPAEATVKIKGGNSNWRGPIWMPANFLIIQALLEHQAYYGDGFQVTLRDGSGGSRSVTLAQAAGELATRLKRLFLVDASGQRAIFGGSALFARPEWRDALLFHEYFHGDDGTGLGAGHQTGWTALVANLFQDLG